MSCSACHYALSLSISNEHHATTDMLIVFVGEHLGMLMKFSGTGYMYQHQIEYYTAWLCNRMRDTVVVAVTEYNGTAMINIRRGGDGKNLSLFLVLGSWVRFETRMTREQSVMRVVLRWGSSITHESLPVFGSVCAAGALIDRANYAQQQPEMPEMFQGDWEKREKRQERK